MVTGNVKPSTRAKWQTIINAQERSGLDVIAYCAEKKICRSSFYARRKQLSKADDKKPGFLRLLSSSRPLMDSLNALTVPAQPPISIRTPNGYQLAIHLSSKNGLGELLEILKNL